LDQKRTQKRKQNKIYIFKLYYSNYTKTPHTTPPSYYSILVLNILPYIKNSKVQRIVGVNSPEKYVLKQHTCKYVFVSGKYKGHICNKQCSLNYCPEHLTIIENNNSEYELTLETIKKYTVLKLKNICRKHKLKGFSRLKKQELINYINKELINT